MVGLSNGRIDRELHAVEWTYLTNCSIMTMIDTACPHWCVSYKLQSATQFGDYNNCEALNRTQLDPVQHGARQKPDYVLAKG